MRTRQRYADPLAQPIDRFRGVVVERHLVERCQLPAGRRSRWLNSRFA